MASSEEDVGRDGGPRVLERPGHTLSRKDISENALKVLYRLKKFGYVSYLVGGAVRDILLGRRPKDFDVVTNARPREVRRLFRNSRTIGRRFRLVHVFFRGEIVEVATFRAIPGEPQDEVEWEDDRDVENDPEEPEVPEDERVYGTPEEDASRRDFTVNALFYNIDDFSIVDYVGGLEDLKRKTIRTIGDPGRRFEEDPVRMLRAIEYGVRLGFELDPATASAVLEHAPRIAEAAPARLTYELEETLASGSAAGILRELDTFGLLRHIHPEAARGAPRLWPVLERMDKLVRSQKPSDPAALMGATFLPRALEFLEPEIRSDRRPDNPHLLRELSDLLEPTGAQMRLPKHVVHKVHQGLFTLTKLAREPGSGRQVLRLSRREYFSVAWMLFDLWVHCAGGPRESLRAWDRALQRVASGRDDERDRRKRGRGGRRGRRRR